GSAGSLRSRRRSRSTIWSARKTPTREVVGVISPVGGYGELHRRPFYRNSMRPRHPGSGSARLALQVGRPPAFASLGVENFCPVLAEGFGFFGGARSQEGLHASPFRRWTHRFSQQLDCGGAVVHFPQHPLQIT